MAGQNPYLQPSDTPPATRKFTVRFIDPEKKERIVEVDPAKRTYDHIGRPGSLLAMALANGIAIDHACGGVCACATCHVIVRAGYETCHPPTDDEEDRLDDAYGLTATSRLACQCVPTGARDLVVEIPSWNRNLAREGH